MSESSTRQTTRRAPTMRRAKHPRPVADTPDEAKACEKTGAGVAGTDASGTKSYTPGLNELRLAVLGIMVTVALGSAALVSGWRLRLVVGLGAFVLSVVAIAWPPLRKLLALIVQKLTGL